MAMSEPGAVRSRAKTEPWGGTHTIVVPIARLFKWKGNPRRFAKKLRELGTSMRRDGQSSPLIVRKSQDVDHVEGDYEIGDGTRRQSAALLVGIEELRCEVREMTDAEMLDLSLSATMDREEFHPLEEGDAYKRLRDDYGHTIAEIALRHNVPEHRVYGRIQLLSLAHGRPRIDFEEGRMSAAVAIQLARLSPVVQARVWTDLTARSKPGVPVIVSENEVRGYLLRTVFLPMSEAPFPRKDKKLLPSAGSCEECPKRTVNQRQLFEQLEEDNCTDPACWIAKRDARVAGLRADADARKEEVLEGPKAKGIFESLKGSTPGRTAPILYTSGYVEVDRPCPSFANMPEPDKTIVQYCGAGATGSARLAIDPDGNPRSLITVKQASTMLRHAGHAEVAKQLPDPTAEQRAEADRREREKAEKEGAKQKRDRVDRALEALVDQATHIGAGGNGFYQFLALSMVRHAGQESITNIARRRGLFTGKTPDRQMLEKMVLTLTVDNMSALGVALELAALRGAYSPHPGGDDLLKRACTVYGFDAAKPPKKSASTKKTPASKPKIKFTTDSKKAAKKRGKA